MKHQPANPVQPVHDSAAPSSHDAADSPLGPLLQRTASPFGSELSVHGAFVVEAKSQDVFTVNHREQGRQYQVKRAASCLLQPEPGDKVLVSGDLNGGLYIIAVLEQCVQGRATIQVEGELTLAADTLSLRAQTQTKVDAPAFALHTQAGAVQATEWEIGSQRHTLRSHQLNVEASESRYAGERRESYYRYVTETTAQSARYVTGTDTVKAVNLDYAADFIARLTGKTTFINGETLLKTDGKQILVG